MKRPLVWCAAVFICGIVLSVNFSFGLLFIFCGCLIFTAYAYGNRLSYLILIPVLLLGMLTMHIYDYKNLRPIEQFKGKTDNLIFRIIECDSSKTSGGYKRYTVKTLSAQGKRIEACGYIYSSEEYNPQELIKSKCEIFPASAADKEGTFDYKCYLINSGITFTAFSQKGSAIGKCDPDIFDRIRSMRNAVITKLKNSVSPKTAGFLTAIITGDKSSLTAYRIETFRKLGISHIIAVSGFHVSALLGMLHLFLGLLHIRKLPKNIICTFFLLFLLPFMNFSPSVCRAVIMGIVMLWSGFFKKDNDSLSSLSIAAIIILAVNPYSLWDLSFILSFTAACGIILLAPPIKDFMVRYTGHEFSVLSSSLAVFIFMIPSQFCYFGQISLISIPANIIFIPPFSIIMFLLIAALATGNFIPAMFCIPDFVSRIYLNAIEAVSALPFITQELPAAEPLLFVLFITAALAYVFKNKMRIMFTVLSLMLAVSVGINIYHSSIADKIYFISDGGIYSVIIKTSEKTFAAIDCTTEIDLSDYQNFKSRLEENKIQDIDILKALSYNMYTDLLKHQINYDFGSLFIDAGYVVLDDGITVSISDDSIKLSGDNTLVSLSTIPEAKPRSRISGKLGDTEVLTVFDNDTAISFKDRIIEFSFNREGITAMKPDYT